MALNCRARWLATAVLAYGLAVLAGPKAVRAELPHLWRSTKTTPKVAVAASQSTPIGNTAANPSTTVRPAVHESATQKRPTTLAAAQKSVPYEEVIELPIKPGPAKTVDLCDDPADAPIPD